jgi:hypothetical protein
MSDWCRAVGPRDHKSREPRAESREPENDVDATCFLFWLSTLDSPLSTFNSRSRCRTWRSELMKLRLALAHRRRGRVESQGLRAESQHKRMCSYLALSPQPLTLNQLQAPVTIRVPRRMGASRAPALPALSSGKPRAESQRDLPGSPLSAFRL